VECALLELKSTYLSTDKRKLTVRSRTQAAGRSTTSHGMLPPPSKKAISIGQVVHQSYKITV